MDDTTLVSRAVGGDRDAFAGIYDRYAGAVLDLCTAVLRDGDEAAEATLDSFLRAAREMVNLRDRSKLRTWLLGVARHEATARAQRAPSTATAPAPADVPVEVPVAARGRAARKAAAGGRTGVVPPPPRTAWPSTGGPEGTGDDGSDDPRRMVWDPVAELSEKDRAVLHLNLRHQLQGEELGEVLGVKAAVADARAARLRSRAETSVGALLLSRSDSGPDPASCSQLSEVLEGWDGRFTAAVAARVDRHARRCDACRERRTMLLGRLRAMASLPFLPPPSWLRQEVLLRMELAVSPRPLPGWDDDGFPPGVGGGGGGGGGSALGPRARTVMVLGAVIAVLAAGFLILRDDGGTRSNVAASDPSAGSLPTIPVAIGGSATTAPAPTTGVTVAVTPTTTVPATTVPGQATTIPTIPPIPVLPAVDPGPQAVADRNPPAIAVGADAASAYVAGCPYSVTGVSADIADQSPLTWVVLFVRRPDGVEDSFSMSFDGGRWRATVGNFAFAGQAVFWVEAVDSEGNRGRSDDQVLDVFACA